MKTRFNPPLFKWAAGLLLLAGLIGLVLFAAAGSHSRLWADDYCYSGFLRGRGFWQAQVEWWETGGNRFSALPLVAASDLLGEFAPAYLPALLLALLAAGFAVLLKRLFQAGRLFSLTGGVLTAYFLALLAPDRIQTLYWRMGAFHYTLPLALLALNAAFGLYAWQRWRGWRAAAAAAAGMLLAWFAAGSSETFAALQTALLLILILFAFARQNTVLRWPAVWRLGLLLAGSLAAMGLMLASPSNVWRQAVLPPPDSLSAFVSLTLRYGLDFVVYSLRGQPLPNLVFFGLAGALSGLFLPYRPGWRRSLLFAAAVIPVTFLLILAVTAPSVFAGSQYPTGRALMPARMALLTGLAVLGGLCGLSLRGFLARRERWVSALLTVILLAGSVYLLRTFSLPLADRAELAVRSARWDQRSGEINAQIAAGQRNLLVRQTDVVASLGDYGPDPEDWINRCAASYYQVQSITALP